MEQVENQIIEISYKMWIELQNHINKLEIIIGVLTGIVIVTLIAISVVCFWGARNDDIKLAELKHRVDSLENKEIK